MDDIQIIQMNPKKQALAVFYTQVLMTALVVGFFAIADTRQAAISALQGAATAILPTLVLIAKMFTAKLRTPAELLRMFYKAELLKWLLTIVLLIFFIKYCHIQPLAFFVAFVAGLMAYWAGFWLAWRSA